MGIDILFLPSAWVCVAPSTPRRQVDSGGFRASVPPGGELVQGGSGTRSIEEETVESLYETYTVGYNRPIAVVEDSLPLALTNGG